MGTIDYITVVVGPPRSQEKKDQLAALAAASGTSFEEVYIDQTPDQMETLGRREPGTRSAWDALFSASLGQPVRIDPPTVSYYEKKAMKYPALIFSSGTLVGPDGQPVQDLATEVLRNMDHRESLAAEFGQCLEVDWVRVFVTFG